MSKKQKKYNPYVGTQNRELTKYEWYEFLHNLNFGLIPGLLQLVKIVSSKRSPVENIYFYNVYLITDENDNKKIYEVSCPKLEDYNTNDRYIFISIEANISVENKYNHALALRLSKEKAVDIITLGLLLPFSFFGEFLDENHSYTNEDLIEILGIDNYDYWEWLRCNPTKSDFN